MCVKQNMGERDSTRLEVAAVRAVADQFDSVAEQLGRAAGIGLGFTGLSAGRAHAAGGDDLRRALDQLAGDLAVWARAAGEIAAALRAGADRYVDADLGVATRIA